MKKLVFFGAISAAVLSVATFVACNSTEEPSLGVKDAIIGANESNFDTFMLSVDSLNKSYVNQSRAAISVSEEGEKPTQLVDERWTRNKLVNYADQAGSVIGGAVGAVGGGIAGGSTGGAASFALGYLGSRLGEIVYSHLYSSIAKLATGYQIVNPGYDVAVTTHGNNSDYTFLDSIGVRHNRLMQRMTKYDKKYMYIDLNNHTLLNEFYVDFMKELNEIYPEVGGFQISTEEKDKLLESSTSVLAIGKSHLDKKDGKKLFINEVSSLMANKYNVPLRKILVFKEFAVSVTTQMDKMDKDDISRYTEDLDRVIAESPIDASDKSSIVSMGQIATNSNICWKK